MNPFINFLGAGVAAAGQVAGGILGAIERAKQRRILRQQEQQNQRWYNRRYNEVGTERADARRALTAMKEAQERRAADAAGRAAVMGTGSAVVAQEKQAANQAIGNTAANINAQAEQRKQAIENQYMQRKDAIQQQRANLHAQQAQQIANAATQVSALGAKALDGLGGTSTGATTQAAVTGDPITDPLHSQMTPAEWSNYYK